MGGRWGLATGHSYRTNIDEPVAGIDNTVYSKYAGVRSDVADDEKNADTKDTFRALHGGSVGNSDGFGGCVDEYIMRSNYSVLLFMEVLGSCLSVVSNLAGVVSMS